MLKTVTKTARLDIQTCFDHLRSRTLVWALQKRGTSPWVTATALEYTELRVKVPFHEEEGIAQIPFSLGGRTGGVRTVELLNEAVQGACKDLVGFKFAAEGDSDGLQAKWISVLHGLTASVHCQTQEKRWLQ